MNLVNQLIYLGHDLEQERGAAHDLWTWLPSYAAAQRAHGDYASQHQPTNAAVAREAAALLAHIRRPRALTPEDRDWFSCPCGESHGWTDDDITRAILTATGAT